MANAVITGTWARCKHGTLLEPGEVMCGECKILERNLSLIPPFEVYCPEDYFAKFKKDKVYTVTWVVRQGSTRFKHDANGYCFLNADGSIYEYMVDPLKFIPMQYLDKNKKDTWREETSS